MQKNNETNPILQELKDLLRAAENAPAEWSLPMLLAALAIPVATALVNIFAGASDTQTAAEGAAGAWIEACAEQATL